MANEGLVSGHTDNVTYSAKGTEVGEYPGTITAKADVKIMSGETDVTAKYDGVALTNDGYELTKGQLAEGDAIDKRMGFEEIDEAGREGAQADHADADAHDVSFLVVGS